MTTSLQGTDDGTGFGVQGVATGGDGVIGTTRGVHKVGVRGIHTGHISAIAVRGELGQGTAAVQGQTGGGSGVGGDEVIGSGVWGDSSRGPGVTGTSSVAQGVIGEGTVGVLGVDSKTTTDIAELGVTGFAGFFVGKVGVTDDLNVNGSIFTLGDVQLGGADLAEQFTVEGDLAARPGAVMVLTGPDCVRVSDAPYDPRVAGVVSGAGEFRPGIVLDRRDGQNRHPLALSGKVWCYADADEGPIGLGDLLTTSRTPGHAMRATDQARAFGAVIGKALAGLETGRGLIPVLVGLR